MSAGTDSCWPDLRLLNFLLELEYLQAEYYLRALDGEGLGESDRGHGAGSVIGGRRVAFDTPLVEAFVRATAREERSHVRVLRDLIAQTGETPEPMPALDFENSFSTFARASGLCRETQTFDAFVNETNLLLGAYIFEDVCSTAYLGAVGAIADRAGQLELAGIMAAEASHAATIRFILFAGGHSDPTNALSVRRQTLTCLMNTPYQGNDHGVGTIDNPSIAPVDGRAIFPSRSLHQCRQILCGNTDGKPGLFFPGGLGTSVEPAPPLSPIADATLASIGDIKLADQIALYPSERVDMPALPFTADELAGYDLRENVPIQPWSETFYFSVAPHVLRLSDAVVHSAVGVVGVGPYVISESLWHTDPLRHRYSRKGQDVVLRTRDIEPLGGQTVSILVGGAENYWHSLIDSIARLILVPEEVWERPSRVLLPSTGIKHLEFFELYGLPTSVSPRVVLLHETFRVESLIYPSSLHGLFNYHPTLLNKCFDRLLSNVPPIPGRSSPKRIFIDRREATLRNLVNEAEVLDTLPGFEAIRLEDLTIQQQIRLFAEADIVIAPHGAGLTNIGFARPGTVIIELMMDTYCNWCYRRIAAIRKLAYMCVLGRSLDAWKAELSVHLQTWTIGIEDVHRAVENAEALVRARDSSEAPSAF